MAVMLVCKQQQGLYSCGLLVHFRYVTLVFEVTDGSDAPDNESGIHLLGEFRGERVIGKDINTRLALVNPFDEFCPFGHGEQAFLLSVYTYSDNDSVEEGQSPSDDIVMPDGEWVETSGKNSCPAHGVVCSVCLFFNNIVFGTILLNNQIVDDEVLSVHGVFPHIVLQKGLDFIVLV